jgi:TonB family protein
VGLFAGDDIAIQLRLYQGFREAESRQSDVVSAYSLEKIFSGNIFSEAEMSKEVKTLAKVFNLEKVKILMNASLVLKVEKGGKSAEVFVLNGRKLVLLLTKVAGDKDMFAVEVKEKEEDAKPLLATDIVVPEGKTATLGFSDSEEKIFFLTLHRGPDQKSTEKDVQRQPKEGKGPKLIKKVSAVYPPEARQAGVEGTVVLEATIDTQGKVTKVRVLKGDNDLLNKAAIEALRQWEYEPFIVDGKPMPFNITVTMRFALDDKSKD